VQYVGRSALVTLAQVRLRRNQNRSFKGGHISLLFSFFSHANRVMRDFVGPVNV
jgi:hypothetical protein